MDAYIDGMRQLWILVPLFALLALVIWYAVDAWTSIQTPMPGFGYLAMFGGVFFSLVIGCGLMALVFYSNRHGYDDIIDHSHKSDRRE